MNIARERFFFYLRQMFIGRKTINYKDFIVEAHAKTKNKRFY